jgi:3D (Asp-Asp-Asp) domain-containing protein/peptidoglycan hydrolase CwlO-like protein
MRAETGYFGRRICRNLLTVDRTKSVEQGALLWYGPALVSGPRTRSAARLAGFSATLALASVSAAGGAGPGNSLRQQVNSLAARTHRALLDLYAVDTRMHAAQTRLSALHAESLRLRNEQILLEQQITATRRTLSVSRNALGSNLRILYKQGDVSALAVVLGAQSLDDAVTRLDALSNVANESRQVVQVARQARSRLETLRVSLQQRLARVDAAAAEARHAAEALAAAEADRSAFISNLRGRQRLKRAQIAALQSTAERVEHKSDALQTAATLDQSTPVPVSDSGTAPLLPGLAPPAPSGPRTITVTSTGYSMAGRTVTGIPTGRGVVAVDPSVIPLGTRLSIPGYGEGVAADTGSSVQGATIDLWFPTLGQANAWGRRTVAITLY